MVDVSFAFTGDFARNTTLSWAEKPRPSNHLRRRDFLIRFCQGAGATLIPRRLWGLSFPEISFAADNPADQSGKFYLHPHYRTPRPLDTTLAKVQSGSDEFTSEKYADLIAAVFARWSESVLKSPIDLQAIAASLATDFSGQSLQPSDSKLVRAAGPVEVRRNEFSGEINLPSAAFLHSWQQWLSEFTQITAAEFQVIRIGLEQKDSKVISLETRVRYVVVGVGKGFHRGQSVGEWELLWDGSTDGTFKIRAWRTLEETQARSNSPVYADVTDSVLGANASYRDQLLHGSDYWRTVLDGACGIDIYGHNGVSLADIHNQGLDDLYVCQPAGLPNRLYRNRGDGTFEDVTERSGLGILENTVCALFADYNNDGHQDLILVRANGPLLFLNDGTGKFKQKPDAFQFANPPQGTFTGAAVADYDRDGWLDIYFCLYAYYQGTGQYRYPLPYHDAENGPANFLLRNNRDGTFRDATHESGLNKNNTRYSFCCAWSDFDRDGWPDLYVVNDFGRKNLYRNNGDGTFTDVAPKAGVEDVGAGMSVCWFDYDRNRAEDIYVANMWTAAGVRISMQENFKPNSPRIVRELYQKHAMGNSLLRNAGKQFEDTTQTSGVGVGRWAWSSDSLDFDHDGFPDLYITNGMVSGPSRQDLNSFFWRQIVARSPDDNHATPEYEQGWNAINELIRSDDSWSGYERNVFYANNGDGTFSDVSGAVGLDFIEDGRSLALADLDIDGRLEICLKNRNAPQLRVLKNVVAELPPSISFRLRGTKSNRDAIGATITVNAGSSQQTRMLQAGSGFLSQHGKDLLFGLGRISGPVSASIRWPSGLVQELGEVPVNHRIWVEEGVAPSRFDPFRKTGGPSPQPTSIGNEEDNLPQQVETWLLSPVAAPEFSLLDVSDQSRTLSQSRGQPVLLNFSSLQSAESREDLRSLQRWQTNAAAKDLHILSVNVDGENSLPALRSLVRDEWITFPVLRATDDALAIYSILYRQLFDRHRDMSLPISFLIDERGDIVKVYQGQLVTDHLQADFKQIPKTDAQKFARALPFFTPGYSLEFGRNYLSFGALFFQSGYLDQAAASFQQALRDDPSSAEALYGIGSVFLNQNKNVEARGIFERAVKAQASYPDTLPDSWNNLGVIATREGRVEQSIPYFEQALKVSPHHLLSLDNLGNAYRLLKRWDDARDVLQRALEVDPLDPEANYSLGMVYAQTDNTSRAYEYLQRALQARPVYPEALNNLGVLLLVTKRPDEAVSRFQECIRVAPTFDQAYLNLARVYALQGARDQARAVLAELLKLHPDHVQAKQMLDQLQQ